ncbi:MAG: D-alanyl-D-alanine carboxypeptidase family protein [Clostridia bacterium]|nr:D-alanyl-D-alanine carboxypeptidase family protein [Clostridia bacterium]
MIKKLFSVLLVSALISLCGVLTVSAIEISAKSAVSIDASSNEILFEKEAFEKRSMASTTKIMTSILAIESGRLDETVEITEKMIRAEGTSIGLKAGYRIKLRDLVYGMMLESGNDAANSVAFFLSGSLENFSELMNRKAASIGMKNTHFVTASGLDDEEHYSTAYDMAILASYCIKNDVFKAVCSTKKYTSELEKPENYRLFFSNHNRLLSENKGVFGVKTGFTKKSGRCLVSAAERDGAVIIVVTLCAPDDWNDHRRLYNSCFEMFSKKTVYTYFSERIPVIGGTSSSVAIQATERSFEIAVHGEGKIKSRVFLPNFVYAPIRKNDVIGKIDYYIGEDIYKTVSLFADESIASQTETYVRRESFITRIKNKIKSIFMKKGSVAAWQITE